MSNDDVRFGHSSPVTTVEQNGTEEQRLRQRSYALLLRMSTATENRVSASDTHTTKRLRPGEKRRTTTTDVGSTFNNISLKKKYKFGEKVTRNVKYKLGEKGYAKTSNPANQ